MAFGIGFLSSLSLLVWSMCMGLGYSCTTEAVKKAMKADGNEDYYAKIGMGKIWDLLDGYNDSASEIGAGDFISSCCLFKETKLKCSDFDCTKWDVDSGGGWTANSSAADEECEGWSGCVKSAYTLMTSTCCIAPKRCSALGLLYSAQTALCGDDKEFNSYNLLDDTSEATKASSCCQEKVLCSSHSCGEGYSTNPDKASTTCYGGTCYDSSCCTADPDKCASFMELCPSDTQRASAGKVGNSSDACCETVTTTTTAAETCTDIKTKIDNANGQTSAAAQNAPLAMIPMILLGFFSL